MKKIYFKKSCAAVIAALAAVSIMTGCKDTSPDSGEAELSESTSLTEMSVSDFVYTVRPLKEGDELAINKINNKSAGDPLPGGYQLKGFVEEQQAKLYLNGKSQVRIMAYNYKEDLLDLPTWADSACASLTLSNIMMYNRGSDFSEPEDVKVCGFDGIRYDCEMIQYKFSETEKDENGEALKEEVYRLRGRNYFFYSEQDAYAVVFETLAEDWDEQSALFEEFMEDLEVTKTEQ